MTQRTTGRSRKAKTPPFAMLVKSMITSPAYRQLSFVARGVLVELLAQYNGDNNGDLSATRTMAKAWGVSSPNMLQKALAELQAGEWIIQTRCSLFSRHGARCALYALSWIAVDECPGKDLEVAATRVPRRTIASIINSP